MRFLSPLANAGLAIALWLSFPDASLARQESGSAENHASSDRKTAESAEKKQTDSGASETPASETRKRQKTTPQDAPPRRVVVRQGGASEPAEQIVPGMTPAETARQRKNAEQWLSSTDVQLKQLAERKLNSQQQETVSQIRNYMNGARAALQEGDVRRANTLAEKAHLLADDLEKH